MDYRALSQMELAKQPFPQVQYDFRIYIDESAFDRICNNAEKTREVGGILVGDVLRDKNGPYIKVDHVIEALHAEEKGTELTITHETWNHIHEQMDKNSFGQTDLRLVSHSSQTSASFFPSRINLSNRVFSILRFRLHSSTTRCGKFMECSVGATASHGGSGNTGLVLIRTRGTNHAKNRNHLRLTRVKQ